MNVTAQANSSCGVDFAGELMAATVYMLYMLCMLYMNVQGSVVTQSVLGGLTVDPPAADVLQCICAKIVRVN